MFMLIKPVICGGTPAARCRRKGRMAALTGFAFRGWRPRPARLRRTSPGFNIYGLGQGAGVLAFKTYDRTLIGSALIFFFESPSDSPCSMT